MKSKKPQTIHDFLKENRRNVEKEHQREWRKEHFFDIFNVVLSSIAIIISIVALIVSIMALS